jgi:hypothetical protein
MSWRVYKVARYCAPNEAPQWPVLPYELLALILDCCDRGSDYIRLHRSLRLTCKSVLKRLPKAPPRIETYSNAWYSAMAASGCPFWCGCGLQDDVALLQAEIWNPIYFRSGMARVPFLMFKCPHNGGLAAHIWDWEAYKRFATPKEAQVALDVPCRMCKYKRGLYGKRRLAGPWCRYCFSVVQQKRRRELRQAHLKKLCLYN